MRKSTVVAIVVAGSLLAAACSTAAGNAPASSPGASPSLTASPEPHVSASPALTAAGECPVTKPKPLFAAPPPAPNKPPDYYKSDWFGTADLWTMLTRGGEIWHDLPKNPGGLTQKTFWWSANWPYRTELEPDITVTGRRLDGPGRFEAGHPGTNASADFGVAMLVGIDVPTTGCWKLTREYRGAALSYVALVED